MDSGYRHCPVCGNVLPWWVNYTEVQCTLIARHYTFIDKLLPESFQTTVPGRYFQGEHGPPWFLEGGLLPTLPLTCRRPWTSPRNSQVLLTTGSGVYLETSIVSKLSWLLWESSDSKCAVNIQCTVLSRVKNTNKQQWQSSDNVHISAVICGTIIGGFTRYFPYFQEKMPVT